MKKQNRNMYAYVRQPNVQHHDQSLIGSNDKIGQSVSNQGMYSEIVGQMDPEITSYLSKLVTKTNKEDDKKKSMQKSLNHQRTKSYADIQVATPSTSKNTTEKGHSHRGSHPSTQINNIFFSLNSTPTNQKPQKPTSQSKKEMVVAQAGNNMFLESLDSYLSDLTNSNSTKHKPPTSQLMERKTIQRTRQNSINNLKMVEKLQTIGKKEKQLRLANHILEDQNQKLKKKLVKNKMKYKEITINLLNETKKFQLELTKVKREKRKLEEIIADFQQKFFMLRPERKTLAPRTHKYNQQYLISSETTEQDDSQTIPTYNFNKTDLKNKGMKRKSMPRSTGLHSQVSGPNIEEISAMLASNNYELEDDDEDESENEQSEMINFH